jgi:outer membrane protein TolC
VVRARAKYEKSEAALRAEYAQRVPWIRFFEVGYLWADRTSFRSGVPVYGERDGTVLGVALDLPILDWNQAGVSAGEARRRQERACFREVLADVLESARSSIERWSAARERLESVAERLAPLLDRVVAQAEQAVAAGRGSEADLLEARDRVLKLRETELDAVEACVEASIDAEYATGAPL